MNKKIVIGLSGGVNSTISVLLLKQQLLFFAEKVPNLFFKFVHPRKFLIFGKGLLAPYLLVKASPFEPLHRFGSHPSLS
jgi:hypothetical protein